MTAPVHAVVLFCAPSDDPPCELNRCVMEVHLFALRAEAADFMDARQAFAPHHIYAQPHLHPVVTS